MPDEIEKNVEELKAALEKFSSSISDLGGELPDASIRTGVEELTGGIQTSFDQFLSAIPAFQASAAKSLEATQRMMAEAENLLSQARKLAERNRTSTPKPTVPVPKPPSPDPSLSDSRHDDHLVPIPFPPPSNAVEPEAPSSDSWDDWLASATMAGQQPVALPAEPVHPVSHEPAIDPKQSLAWSDWLEKASGSSLSPSSSSPEHAGEPPEPDPDSGKGDGNTAS